MHSLYHDFKQPYQIIHHYCFKYSRLKFFCIKTRKISILQEMYNKIESAEIEEAGLNALTNLEMHEQVFSTVLTLFYALFYCNQFKVKKMIFG